MTDRASSRAATEEPNRHTDARDATIEPSQGDWQFTLRGLLVLTTVLAAMIVLSTPPDPPTAEVRRVLMGDRFGPTQLLGATCIFGLAFPPVVVYGRRRESRCSQLVILMLLAVSVYLLYTVRYELGYWDWVSIEPSADALTLRFPDGGTIEANLDPTCEADFLFTACIAEDELPELWQQPARDAPWRAVLTNKGQPVSETIDVRFPILCR